MKNLPNYVLDTNIFVSALLFKNSQPRQALDKARHLGTILMSRSIWQEITEVLTRPRFERYVTSIEGNLLILNPFCGISIVTVRDFLEME